MSPRARLGFAGRVFCLAIAAVASLAAILCPVAAAVHTPGHYFLRPYHAIRFRVHGSHGYVVGVAEGSRGHFAVTVRGHQASTEYQLKDRARPGARDRIDGDLGRFGSVSVRFSPRGEPYRLPRYPWCTGPGPTIQPGIVRGKFRFRGERGYARAVAHQAKAELETTRGSAATTGKKDAASTRRATSPSSTPIARRAARRSGSPPVA